MTPLDDKKTLLYFIGGSILTYNAILRIYQYYQRQNASPFVPVGTVKELAIYPIKSCKGKKVFSLYCGPHGVISGENRDRSFMVVNGETGLFYTARQKPPLVLVAAEVLNGHLVVDFPSGKQVKVDLEAVKKAKNIMRATLFDKLKQDGYDCGDEIAAAFTEYIGEPNTRLIYDSPDLYTERAFVPEDSWWENNPVPKNKFSAAYNDIAPYLVATQASLDDLNARLDNKVTMNRFRPEIVVEHCPAWDEDKWNDIRIGDVQLLCFKPCDRCILTTVDPETGVMNKDMQPLKKLREFRLAPEGPMRKAFKDSPLFGVNTGCGKQGYVHVGQVVYARYKPSVF